jgi:5-methylcytosine-specific restriction endonuclease McrA
MFDSTNYLNTRYSVDMAMTKEEKKAYDKAYNEAHKEEKKASQALRRNTPEGKAKIAAYNNSPEGKASRAAASATYEKTPEGKAKIAAYNNSPEGKAKRAAASAAHDNSPEGKAKKAAYEKTPEGKASRVAASMRRRAKKAGVVNLPIRKNFLEHLIQGYDDKCAYCRKYSDKYHMDHFMPIELKGHHAEYNLVLACPFCNHSKGCKDPYIWLKEKEISFTKPDYMLVSEADKLER